MGSKSYRNSTYPTADLMGTTPNAHLAKLPNCDDTGTDGIISPSTEKHFYFFLQFLTLSGAIPP